MKPLGSSTSKETSKTDEQPETGNSTQPGIPATVASVYGDETPYAYFKEQYISVYEQVTNMEHLLLGRVMLSGKIAGKLGYTLQSLSQSENALLTALFPKEAQTNPYYARDMILFDNHKLCMALTHFNGSALPLIPVSMTTSKEDWLKKAEAKLELLASYDGDIVYQLSLIHNDLSTAKRFAFMELMPHP